MCSGWTEVDQLLFFFYLLNLRVPLGILVLRVDRGLQEDQAIQASKDLRGRKVNMAMVVS